MDKLEPLQGFCSFVFTMENLPNEVILHILGFCQFKDVLSFCSTKAEYRDVPKNEYFWSCYSMQRSHPRKFAGYTPKQWAIKQENMVPISLTCGVGGTNKVHKLSCGGTTVADLKKEISLKTSYSPHKIVVREKGVVIEKDQNFSGKSFSHFPGRGSTTLDTMFFDADE
ncbi:F-box containing protein [Insectomime virus]|uniref:F-box containing protein n=1 Tax=Tunisvirus fontaine2 TaxID=1421067 RepID=V9SGT8_9VIRU|nr:F-box containing protein [Tunisvirus fontaine2]AHA46308.1 F-box containing protein [Insectomime virus]AHC55109.1 F-box containing protein [Tunisvirus fontaine2]